MLTKKLEHVLEDYSYEILFVDDGSSDRTLERIKTVRKSIGVKKKETWDVRIL